jgi:putative DNA primase/helicase
VAEVQAFTQAPMALVASSALSAVSLAVQPLVDVQRASQLIGPVSLYLLTVADSGERKSTCDGYFTRAIYEFQEECAEAAKPELADYRADKLAWEAKRDGLRETIRQDTKSGKSTVETQEKLRDIESTMPQAPRVPRLLRGDETPENLAWALAREWPSGAVISAEAGLILGAHGMGKDSVMRNLALLNTLWDGKSHSVGRRTSESFTVKGARLTVGLQVQQAAIESFFERSDGLARGTGFLARFLVAWPESTQGTRRYVEPPANWPALSAFNSRLGELLAVSVAIDDDGGLTPKLVVFSPRAKTAWVNFHDAIEDELRIGGELADCKDFASKAADNAARLAALFHVFEQGQEGAISADTFENASRIVAWHLSEARRFFGQVTSTPALANAELLDGFLIQYAWQQKTGSVPRRTIEQYGPNRLRSRETIEVAVAELAALGRAKMGGEGRKQWVDINPALLAGGN